MNVDLLLLSRALSIGEVSPASVASWLLAGCPGEPTVETVQKFQNRGVGCEFRIDRVLDGTLHECARVRVRSFVPTDHKKGIKPHFLFKELALGWVEFCQLPGSADAWSDFLLSRKLQEESKFVSDLGAVIIWKGVLPPDEISQLERYFERHFDMGGHAPVWKQPGVAHQRRHLQLWPPSRDAAFVPSLEKTLKTIDLDFLLPLIRSAQAHYSARDPDANLSLADLSIRSILPSPLPASEWGHGPHRDDGLGAVSLLYIRPAEAGGELAVNLPDHGTYYVSPSSGDFLLMDGEVEHAVHQTLAGHRITLGMAWGRCQTRDAEKLVAVSVDGRSQLPLDYLHDALCRAFNRFDLDRDGIWTESDLRSFLLATNSEVSARMINEFSNAETHTCDSGLLCRQDFIAFMSRVAARSPADIVSDLSALGIPLETQSGL